MTAAAIDRRTRRPVAHLGRAGWVARAVVYATLAVLVGRLAATGGRSRNEADQGGAIEAIARQPLGAVLLTILALGLAGFAAWRLWVAFFGECDRFERLTFVVSATFHAVVAALAAAGVLRGLQSGKESDTRARMGTAVVLDWPAGRVMVAGIGLVLLGVAAVFLWRAVTCSVIDDADIGSLPGVLRRAATVAAGAGSTARAAIFGLVGWFLVQAALQHDPNEAKGLDDALRTVAARSSAPLVLWAMATGLAAYAATCLVVARYHSFEEE